jgi:hypothetical protein
MKLDIETKKMLAGKIVDHAIAMQTEDDLFVGAISGGLFGANQEAEQRYVEGVGISQERHSVAIGVAAKYLGFDRSQTAIVLREAAISGTDVIEAILTRSTNY